MAPSFSTIVLMGLVALQPALTSPVAIPVEIIPGDGLPSLASLGLTSADLMEMPLPKLPANEMSAMFTPTCGPFDSAYTNVSGIIGCFHYLNNLGNTFCKVGPGAYGTIMCQAGFDPSDAAVEGLSTTEHSEQSYCSDVAVGLLWVINGCTRPDQTVAGFNAANGNGNLIVGGTNLAYAQS